VDLLRVRLHDAGMVEAIAVSPRPHEGDAAWQALEGLPLGQPMPLESLAAAVRKVPRPLPACTFSIEVTDASGNDKANFTSITDRLRTFVYVHKAGSP
jgi:hypothetical protein